MSGAVKVGVVAAERHVAAVCRGNPAVPAQGRGRCAVPKVLLDEGRRTAEPEDVVAGVRGQLDGLLEAALKLPAEGDVARLVDGEFGDGAFCPVVDGGGGSGARVRGGTGRQAVGGSSHGRAGALVIVVMVVIVIVVMIVVMAAALGKGRCACCEQESDRGQVETHDC